MQPSLQASWRSALGGAPGQFEALIARPMAAKLDEYLAGLPPVFSALGLECRLTPGDDRIDVGVCLERASARTLVDMLGSVLPSELRSWGTAASQPLAGVPHAWLELDHPLAGDGAEGWRRSFAFFRVAEAFAGKAREECSAALLTELDLPRDRALESAAALERALPRRGRLLHLARLRHRGADEVRAHVSLPPSAAIEYLTSGHRTAGAAATLVSGLVAGLPLPLLALQLGSTGHEFRVVSVELSLPHTPWHRSTWSVLAERLVEVGLADAAKLAAARIWPELSVHTPPELAAPESDRSFHLTVRLDEPPVAKAYLYLTPRHRSDQESAA